jgi:glycosyltransferase involved in cell wall biosynthesis
VVVPTRDRVKLLERCLSELRNVLGEDDEVLVVDSGSRDPRVAEVARSHGARCLRVEMAGTSIARNRGWREARHDLIAFVDDDVLVTEDWARNLRAAFAADPALGFVTGGTSVPAAQAGIHSPVSVNEHATAEELRPGDPRPRGVSGNLAVRVWALDRVGGFDEMLGPGRRFRAAEDRDLFDRLLLAGVRGRYEPGMSATHDQWRSRQQRLMLNWAYGVGAGARLAKLIRLNRRLARRVANDLLVRWGVRDLATSVRRGYKFGVAAALIRIAGILSGLAMALPMEVREGHFVGQATARIGTGRGRAASPPREARRRSRRPS